MKSLNKIIVVIVIAIVAIGGYALRDKISPIFAKNKNPSVPATTINEWVTYENTAYYYKIKYPHAGAVQQKYAGEIEPDKKMLHSISFGVQETTLVGVFVPKFYLDINNTTPELAQAANHLLSLDLKSFVQEVRQHHMDFVKNHPDYSNDYKSMVKTGEIMELSFLGNKAYAFTLVGSLDTGTQGPLVRSPYETYRYVFVEHAGTKYIIVSTYNDKLSESILNTFEFTDK